ncbi:MAG: sigma-70 family RNA polymerase sigma factor [Gammaproteobacteria bacterium]|nr:sigma-70 family RNA polymerase sigma factor [Gammaproteobacteria bacterium]
MTASVRARERSRDPRSDETLVRTCNRGGPGAAAAFDALYRRHKDYVLRVALRFAPDMDTALDVLQETFLQLLRKFPPSGDGIELTARLTTLLYPIARNAAIDARRRAARLPVDADVTPDDLAAAPEPDTHDLGELLAGLPDHQREVLTLRFVDGLTLDEVAQTLAIPLGTVKSRLHLGVARLRASPALKDYFAIE